MMRTDVLTTTSHSEAQTHAIGLALGRILVPGDTLALHGDLGAGKTRLVRGIAEGMRLDPSQVSSPTYVIHHAYETPMPVSIGTPPDAPTLHHLDAYRLEGSDDLDSIGWELIADGSGVVVIEWASRIDDAITRDNWFAQLAIEHTGDEDRAMTLTMPASWHSRPGAEGLNRAFIELPAGHTLCPISGEPVAPDNPFFPFIDERAKLADLHAWLNGDYALTRDLTEDDFSDPSMGGTNFQ